MATKARLVRINHLEVWRMGTYLLHVWFLHDLWDPRRWAWKVESSDGKRKAQGNCLNRVAAFSKARQWVIKTLKVTKAKP